nr:MAG TPA: hypothetical protein [Bacteriophage sp.]
MVWYYSATSNPCVAKMSVLPIPSIHLATFFLTL